MGVPEGFQKCQGRRHHLSRLESPPPAPPVERAGNVILDGGQHDLEVNPVVPHHEMAPRHLFERARDVPLRLKPDGGLPPRRPERRRPDKFHERVVPRQGEPAGAAQLSAPGQGGPAPRLRPRGHFSPPPAQVPCLSTASSRNTRRPPAPRENTPQATWLAPQSSARRRGRRKRERKGSLKGMVGGKFPQWRLFPLRNVPAPANLSQKCTAHPPFRAQMAGRPKPAWTGRPPGRAGRTSLPAGKMRASALVAQAHSRAAALFRPLLVPLPPGVVAALGLEFVHRPLQFLQGGAERPDRGGIILLRRLRARQRPAGPRRRTLLSRVACRWRAAALRPPPRRPAPRGSSCPPGGRRGHPPSRHARPASPPGPVTTGRPDAARPAPGKAQAPPRPRRPGRAPAPARDAPAAKPARAAGRAER